MNGNKEEKKVTEPELRRIVLEQKRFPMNFSSRISLERVVRYSHKVWTNDFTDDEPESDTDDKL